MTLCDTNAAAKALAVSPEYLRKDRAGRRLIPFLRVGSRTVRYDLEVVRAELAKQQQGGTK